MNNTSLISNIIKLSVEFDNLLKTNNTSQLDQKNDLLKSELQNLMVLQQVQDSDSLRKLVDLCSDLYNINSYVLKNLPKSREISASPITHQELYILFHNNDTRSDEWTKLKQNNQAKFIEVNCQNHDTRTRELCSKFNITKFPTIKHIF